MGALALGSYEFSFLPNQMIHQQSTLGLEMAKRSSFFALVVPPVDQTRFAGIPL